ncbi:pleckstrin homology domain-containing family M member 1 [Periophthalmus magnuspinnatus]|uniref:pleckstrin homology domain-containing family M member 1 n=1 Tax=Periophthalmus magnuspinnatus TaxID=409849 RepID=UPI00145B7276|nr:pleckstrin homology domain-containing family M member 1 [Periophthalmus magnuspinnatus]
MLATQMPETLPDTKDVKQIKDRLVQSLKALQKRYVTSDTVVTSEDGDANLLCSALEAVFIHGIRSKFIRSDNGIRGRKKEKGLPQPAFWSLLKTVTHRDVITELEKLNFVTTEVGRCRAWLRLALNHGLLECYLVSLFREESKLQTHYQPNAILLNPEEREVLLSYLQGLSSLTFDLSYKSAVLKEWTTTPLALAGLCPMSQLDALEVNGDATAKANGSESWDSVSQTSSSSDALDLPKEGQVLYAGQGDNGGTDLTSSNLSLDTTGSSHLSSSLSSDSLLQGQEFRSPAAEQSSASDLDVSVTVCSNRPAKDLFKTQDYFSQDSMREDSFVSSSGPDQLSENAISSSSDSETQETPIQNETNQETNQETTLTDPSPPPHELILCSEIPEDISPSNESNQNVEPNLDYETPEKVKSSNEEGKSEPVPNEEDSNMRKDSSEDQSEPVVEQEARRSASVLSRQHSESLSYSRSWISDDDIYKPTLEEVPDLHQDETSVQGPNLPEPNAPQSTPPLSVVHRRKTGLSNPFRGLLKLGHLERRHAMGMWRDYYCELSPFEFRLYLNAEERTCAENCSLVRCDDARLSSSDGRFELSFSGKRLYLRAADSGEAEDWLDRIQEAVHKCRPVPRVDEHWEVLQLPPVASVPSSPDLGGSSSDSGISEEAPHPKVFDWSRSCDVESDAIKESVLYCCTDSEAQHWAPLVFSLSLEALKGFKLQENRKQLWINHPIQDIRDVVPDVSMGGAEFFKLLTVRETLRLRAENPKEARSWRDLVRGALDSYLESGEDGTTEEPIVAPSGINGNLYRLVQHRLKEDGTLLTHLCTVPVEKGLDSQSFKCAGCPRQIGPSRSRARLCEFTGQYYCDFCHVGETTIIPSRMVHNWDLVEREVSKKALRLLAEVQHEPLLNLDQLNPDLMTHSESMAQIHKIRQKLRLLGDYLLTCRSNAWKRLQARMEQRPYLLESSQLYSILDLRQIAEGQYPIYLITLVQLASNHVFQCDLCTQRGFICQTCHSNEIIFPFQFDSTTRCKDCKAVFHLHCKSTSDPCPRCLRIKKYQERDMQD